MPSGNGYQGHFEHAIPEGLARDNTQRKISINERIPAHTAGQLIRTIPTTYDPSRPPGQLIFVQHRSPAPNQVRLVWRAARWGRFYILGQGPGTAVFDLMLDGMGATDWRAQPCESVIRHTSRLLVLRHQKVRSCTFVPGLLSLCSLFRRVGGRVGVKGTANDHSLPPLIEPNGRISHIRLSELIHLRAFQAAVVGNA